MLKITSYVTFYYNPNLEEVADKICEEMKELVTCLVAWIAFGERNVSHDDFEVLIAKWFWPLTDDDFGSRQRPQDVPIGYHRLKVGAALLLSKQIRIIAWLIFLLLQLLFPLFSPSVLTLFPQQLSQSRPLFMDSTNLWHKANSGRSRD